MNEKCNLFNFLSPNIFYIYNNIHLHVNEIIDYSNTLQKKFNTDLTTEFPLQLVMLVSMDIVKEELAKLNSIKEFIEFLMNRPLIHSSVPDVVTSLLLFLTIPVTSANSERSFSKMKIIKNYLRSTQQQERHSELAILAIEAKKAEQMDIRNL